MIDLIEDTNNKKNTHARLCQIFLYGIMKNFRHTEGTANTMGTCVPATQLKKTPYHLTKAAPFPMTFPTLPPSGNHHLEFDAYSIHEWPLAFTHMHIFLNNV